MRSRTPASWHTAGFNRAHARPAPRSTTRIGRAFSAVVDWLRAGYPDEAPSSGHSPLIALNGPMSLSSGQTVKIVKDLEGQPAEPIEVQVAITKATGRLPTITQSEKIYRAIALRPEDA